MALRHNNKLLTYLRAICLRPGMYAGSPEHFNIFHLFIFILGYEEALHEAGQPSQIKEFEDWLNARNPQWHGLTSWWGSNILSDCNGDVRMALNQIMSLLDQFIGEKV